MKTLKLSILLSGLLLLCGLAASQGKGAWTVFKPSDSVFSVKMPGTPTVQTQNVPSPQGNMLIKIYVLKNGQTFYTIEDMKTAKMPAQSDVVLQGFQQGFLSTSGMELVSGQATKYKGYAARTMMFKKDTKRVRGLAFIVDNRILAFFGAGESTQMNSPAITGFFNSIKVKGK